jgi:hypothetical protein
MSLRAAIVRVKRGRDEAACPELGGADGRHPGSTSCALGPAGGAAAPRAECPAPVGAPADRVRARRAAYAPAHRAAPRSAPPRAPRPPVVLEATNRRHRAADLAEQMAAGMALGGGSGGGPAAAAAAAAPEAPPRAPKRCRFMRVGTRSAEDIEVRQGGAAQRGSGRGRGPAAARGLRQG